MKRTLLNRLKVFVLSLALLPLFAAPAAAVLKDVGPTSPDNGFPVWYRDLSRNVLTFTQGLPLELCLSQTQSPAGGPGTYMCNLLPAPADGPPFTFDPANPIVFPTHFPDEAFWWSADAIIDTPRYQGTLVLGLEAAFGGGDVLPGDQVSFGRVRIRIDVPELGNYRVTHPYGVNTFFNVPAGIRTINHTSDIGIGAPGDFTGALRSALGPFLIWDTEFPVVVGNEMFIGDPNVEHTVTGSPFNTNFFRIERLDADGNVLETVETNLFSITGKIYTTPIPGPLKVARATYARPAAGGAQVDVFATSGAISNVDTPSTLVVNQPLRPAITMQTVDNENHAAHLEADPNALPATVSVTNTADVPPTRRSAAVTDIVTITEASYDPVLDQLTVAAVSSDELIPPVLTTPFGPLVDGVLAAPGVTVPPPFVEVTSTAGGNAVAPVIIAPAGFDGGLVLAPNGGETLVSGSTFTVKWSAVPNAVDYRLFYSTDNGATFIAVRRVVNATTFAWTVPTVAAPETDSIFRITARDAAGVLLGVYRSNAFTITP